MTKKVIEINNLYKEYQLGVIGRDTFYRDFQSFIAKIQNKPDATQRELASELGFSLGKLNYCLKALQEKGLVKIENFKKNPKKINYIYVLTPKGISEKTRLTLNFMKRKLTEYEELKKEIKNQDE